MTEAHIVILPFALKRSKGGLAGYVIKVPVESS
jgi:hypothetical protein